MINNNDRTEHRGFKIGQKVRFRFCGANYTGKITRLTQSKAYIKFDNAPHLGGKYISYRQIESKS